MLPVDEVIQIVYAGVDGVAYAYDGDDLEEVTEEQIEEAFRELDQAAAVNRGAVKRQESGRICAGRPR